MADSQAYAREIRKLSDEYRDLTGNSPFTGFSQASGKYAFDAGSLTSGVEAVGYMRERLLAARRRSPEPCIALPGEPCLHDPQHETRRQDAGLGGLPDHSECIPAEWGSNTHRHEGIPGSWKFPAEVA